MIRKEITVQNTIFSESMKGLSISRIVRDFDYTMPDVHIHYNNYEIYYLLEGERRYFIGSKIYPLHAGTLLFIRRNVIHKTAFSRQAHHDRILLEVSHPLLSSILAATGEYSPETFFDGDCIVLPLKDSDQQRVKTLLLSIGEEMRVQNPGWQLMIQSRLAELLISAKRLEARQTAKPPQDAPSGGRHAAAEEIARYIAEHFSEPLALDALAKHFFLNKSYLSRIFKEVTGFTVGEYIHIRRIQKARALLSQTRMSISAVSEASGYDNLVYFERIFKRHTGLTPRQYRKQQSDFS